MGSNKLANGHDLEAEHGYCCHLWKVIHDDGLHVPVTVTLNLKHRHAGYSGYQTAFFKSINWCDLPAELWFKLFKKYARNSRWLPSLTSP